MDVDARTRRYDALNLIAQPVWIFDVELRRIHWANRAALAVWCDTSLERLCMRDLGSDMSDAVATRLEQFHKDFISHDAVFVEQWTIYPVGGPVPLTVRISGHRLDDGRMAMLCEAGVSAVQEPESLRSVEAQVGSRITPAISPMASAASTPARSLGSTRTTPAATPCASRCPSAGHPGS